MSCVIGGMANWPWPADTRTDKLRRIIDHYRDALAEADYEACVKVDNRMIAYGQPWVCDNSIVDVNEMLSAKDMAARFGFTEFDVRNWARLHPEKIRTHKTANRRVLFRVGDVLSFSANRKQY